MPKNRKQPKEEGRRKAQEEGMVALNPFHVLSPFLTL